jgi:hypothetical protein
MTAERENSNKTDAQLHPLDMARHEAAAVPDMARREAAPASTQSGTRYEVGYGRPPAHTRFKPGQSGNPKGRPKGKRNMLAMRRDAYLQPVKLANGRKVPAIVAVDMALLGKALKGDARAALTAVKMATEIGIYDEIGRDPTGLTDEELRALTGEELEQLSKIIESATERTRRPN